MGSLCSHELLVPFNQMLREIPKLPLHFSFILALCWQLGLALAQQLIELRLCLTLQVTKLCAKQQISCVPDCTQCFHLFCTLGTCNPVECILHVLLPDRLFVQCKSKRCSSFCCKKVPAWLFKLAGGDDCTLKPVAALLALLAASMHCQHSWWYAAACCCLTLASASSACKQNTCRQCIDMLPC